MNLSKEQIEDLVFTNKYEIDASQKFLSRCIEGGYTNTKDLHPLSIAGADPGDLAILFATANTYGFEIQEEKVYKTFLDVVGGVSKISIHESCVHMNQLLLDPEAYSLDADQIEFINSHFGLTKKNSVKSHMREGAIVQIRGDWGVYPQHKLSTAAGSVPVQVFMFHKKLADDRHKVLAKKLIENKAVTLYDDLDEEYLYQVISSTTEDHFFETLKRISAGLPMYEVKFESNGNHELTELGNA